MKRAAIALLASLLAFLVGDALWLTVIAGAHYQAALGPLLRPEPMVVPALSFYPIYVFGLFIFAIRPGLSQQRWQTAALHAALLGLVAYSTYDLSNLATLQGWSAGITLLDIAWGCTISTLSALAGFHAARRIAA